MSLYRSIQFCFSFQRKKFIGKYLFLLLCFFPFFSYNVFYDYYISIETRYLYKLYIIITRHQDITELLKQFISLCLCCIYTTYTAFKSLVPSSVFKRYIKLIDSLFCYHFFTVAIYLGIAVKEAVKKFMIVFLWWTILDFLIYNKSIDVRFNF